VSYPGRTNMTEMAKICTLDANLDTSLAIDLANELVTEICATVMQDDGVTPFHSDHRLKSIETLLACHFYCLNDPRAQRQRVGPLTFEAQSKVDIGLNVTHYGQQAMRLDTSGKLAALEAGVVDGKVGKFVASLKWAGKSYANWPTSPADIQGVP
jgi:hypothetical protein